MRPVCTPETAMIRLADRNASDFSKTLGSEGRSDPMGQRACDIDLMLARLQSSELPLSRVEPLLWNDPEKYCCCFWSCSSRESSCIITTSQEGATCSFHEHENHPESLICCGKSILRDCLLAAHLLKLPRFQVDNSCANLVVNLSEIGRFWRKVLRTKKEGERHDQNTQAG